MNLAHHPSPQGKDASACHLTKGKNRQTVKLTPLSSLALSGRYANVQSSNNNQTAHISLQIYYQCQKAEETKSRKLRHSSDAPSGRSFPDFSGQARGSFRSVQRVPPFGEAVSRVWAERAQAKKRRKFLRLRRKLSSH